MFIKGGSVFLVAAFVALATATSVQEGPKNEVEEMTMMKCIQLGDTKCMKLRALANLFKFIKTRSMELVSGVKLEYSGDPNAPVEAARTIVTKGWSSLLTKTFPKFIDGLAVKFDIFPGFLRVSRSKKQNGLFKIALGTDYDLKESRGKNKKMLVPFLVIGGVFALMVTVGLATITAVTFKSLILGKLAMLLSAITGYAKNFGKDGMNQGFPPTEGLGYLEKNFAGYVIQNALPVDWRRHGFVPPPPPPYF